MRRQNPSSPRRGSTCLSMPFSGSRCRGEDSNLCFIARLHLRSGNPLLAGSGLARGYTFASALMLTAAQWRLAPVALVACALALRHPKDGRRSQ